MQTFITYMASVLVLILILGLGFDSSPFALGMALFLYVGYLIYDRLTEILLVLRDE